MTAEVYLWPRAVAVSSCHAVIAKFCLVSLGKGGARTLAPVPNTTHIITGCSAGSIQGYAAPGVLYCECPVCDEILPAILGPSYDIITDLSVNTPRRLQQVPQPIRSPSGAHTLAGATQRSRPNRLGAGLRPIPKHSPHPKPPGLLLHCLTCC